MVCMIPIKSSSSGMPSSVHRWSLRTKPKSFGKNRIDFADRLFDELFSCLCCGLISLDDCRLLLTGQYAQIPPNELLQFGIERRQLPRYEGANGH